MSEIKVDKISPQSGTALQIGDASDVITIPSGATITNSGTANGFASPLYESIAIISDDKTYLVSGGTMTLGAWRTRDLNTEVSDADGIVSISTNQFTLGAGTYTIEWFTMGFYIGTHVTRLYNITDSSVTGWGSQPTGYANTGSDSSGVAVTTIAGSKVFELQHRCDTTRATNGAGAAIGHSGVTNRWSTIKILKHT